MLLKGRAKENDIIFIKTRKFQFTVITAKQLVNYGFGAQNTSKLA